MRKPKPTFSDKFRKANLPRWYNPLWWLTLIVLSIVGSIAHAVAGVCEFLAELMNWALATYEQARGKYYDWETESYLDYRDLLDSIGERMKKEGDLDAANTALSHARRYGLEAEVVAWALNSMKENPKLTLAEALSYGLQEWDI